MARAPGFLQVGGSPHEYGYVESFTGKLRDELLERKIFYAATEALGLVRRC